MTNPTPERTEEILQQLHDACRAHCANGGAVMTNGWGVYADRQGDRWAQNDDPGCCPWALLLLGKPAEVPTKTASLSIVTGLPLTWVRACVFGFDFPDYRDPNKQVEPDEEVAFEAGRELRRRLKADPAIRIVHAEIEEVTR